MSADPIQVRMALVCGEITLAEAAIALGWSEEEVRSYVQRMEGEPSEPEAPISEPPAPYAHVPDQMKRARRWLLWRAVANGGDKPRKVPYYASRGQRRGTLDSPEDTAQLVTFDKAWAELQQRPAFYAGLGFALGPDGTGMHWQGIDLDHLSERSWLQPLADALPGYTETSPSGDGRHAIGYGRSFATLGSNASGIEAYSRSRFFTVTGNAVGISEIADIAAYVEQTLDLMHREKGLQRADVSSGRIPEGGRNNTLASMGGSMRHAGFDESAIRAALLAHNEGHCAPPLPEREVAHIARSTSKYEPHDHPNSAKAADKGGPLPACLFDAEGKPKTQATVLIELGRRHYLFVDEDGVGYARVKVDDHAEVHLIDSKPYRDLLAMAYFRLSEHGANRNAIGDAIATLSATAKASGKIEAVHLRVGRHGDCIVIDTGTHDFSVIEVATTGWRVVHNHPANFRRGTKTGVLPAAKADTPSEFELIWKYINVAKADRVLVAAWLVAALRPEGPYPILLLLGEQGTGKSFTSRSAKALTDPSGIALRAPPKDERDLLVSAMNSRVLVLDNLSGANPQLSDALCRLATGGALAARKLYTDAEEAAFEIQRPMILNGIDDLASRPDLAERCIHLELPVLALGRRTEAELTAEFEQDGPKILAALLNAVSLAMRDHARVDIGQRPRMADFAMWAAAGLPALGHTAGDFLQAYRANQADAVAMGLEASAFGAAVCTHMALPGIWEGTAAELLGLLSKHRADDDHTGSWPRSPKGVINALRRLGPSLRSVGITFEYFRTSEQRKLRLCKSLPDASHPSHTSQTTSCDDGLTHMTCQSNTCTRPDGVKDDSTGRVEI